MFGFGKKKKTYFASKVLMTREALDSVLLDHVRNQNIVVTFFSQTRKDLLKKLNDSSLEDLVIPAEKILNGTAVYRSGNYSSTKIILGERYPLSAKETELAQQLEANFISLPIDIYCALNDPMMLQAGGEKIQSLMQRMGMKEDEIIAHSMIESSIEKFQSKIAAKIITESHTQSAAEWFRINFPLNS
jgi:hypothetical protein